MLPIIATYRNVFDHLDRDHIDLVETLYETGIVFRDPIHQLEGLEAVKGYFRQLYRDLISIKVTYGDEIVSGQSASIPWVMTLRHGKLNRGRPFDVTGVSLLWFREKIYAQQDYFDVGEMVYEQVPVVGAVIRHIKKRLQS